MEEKDKTVAKLEAEKYYLGTRIFELTGVEEGFWSDEILVRLFHFYSIDFLFRTSSISLATTIGIQSLEKKTRK